MCPWTGALAPSYWMPHLQDQPTPVSSSHIYAGEVARHNPSNSTANVTTQLTAACVSRQSSTPRSIFGWRASASKGRVTVHIGTQS